MDWYKNIIELKNKKEFYEYLNSIFGKETLQTIKNLDLNNKNDFEKFEELLNDNSVFVFETLRDIDDYFMDLVNDTIFIDANNSILQDYFDFERFFYDLTRFDYFVYEVNLSDDIYFYLVDETCKNSIIKWPTKKVGHFLCNNTYWKK